MEIVFLELFKNSDSSILATSPSSLVIFSFKFQCFLRISESLNSTFQAHFLNVKLRFQKCWTFSSMT